LGELGGHFHKANFLDGEAGAVDVADTGFCPNVVDCHQEDDVLSQAHTVLEKRPDLTPWRVGHDPIHRLLPVKEVPSFVDFTPVCPWHEAVKMPCAPAGFQNSTCGIEMINDAFGKMEWGHDHVVAVIISVWLIFHSRCGYSTSLQKYREICIYYIRTDKQHLYQPE